MRYQLIIARVRIWSGLDMYLWELLVSASCLKPTMGWLGVAASTWRSILRISFLCRWTQNLDRVPAALLAPACPHATSAVAGPSGVGLGAHPNSSSLQPSSVSRGQSDRAGTRALSYDTTFFEGPHSAGHSAPGPCKSAAERLVQHVDLVRNVSWSPGSRCLCLWS